MARTLREWLKPSGVLLTHPQIARFVGSRKPHLWVPRRSTVALGAAIGAAISVVPVPGQAAIAALAAIRFRAHLPTAVIASFLGNPLTMLPLWATAWMLGSFCLGEPVEWPHAMLSLNATEWEAWILSAGRPLLIGLPMLAGLLGFFFFGLTHLSWRLAIIYKWNTRHAH